MSRSPRVEAPSACEMVRHLRSPGPPGRGEQTSTPLAYAAFNIRSRPGCPAAQMQQVPLGCTPGLPRHACSRATPGTGTAGWAGSLGRGSKPDLPLGNRRRAWRAPRAQCGVRGRAGVTRAVPTQTHSAAADGGLEKRGPCQCRCICPRSSLASDCSLTTVINTLFFLTGTLTFYSGYFVGDFF